MERGYDVLACGDEGGSASTVSGSDCERLGES